MTTSPPGPRTLLETLKELPLVRIYRRRAFDRYFARETGKNLYRGVFGSFAEAAASAPQTRKLGYDNPEPAQMYKDRLDRVFPSDYPVMFWLKERLPSLSRVFDVGGHVGIAYYAYEQYLQFSPKLTWQVYDVPSVVREGEALAAARGKPALKFTSSWADADGADLLLASGSLQYIDEPLAARLAALKKRPAELILNKTPVYDGPAFVTLQSIGTAFCPYRIFNRAELLQPLEALGYELVDAWENADGTCNVAFEPGRSVRAYSGFHLRRRASR